MALEERPPGHMNREKNRGQNRAQNVLSSLPVLPQRVMGLSVDPRFSLQSPSSPMSTLMCPLLTEKPTTNSE